MLSEIIEYGKETKQPLINPSGESIYFQSYLMQAIVLDSLGTFIFFWNFIRIFFAVFSVLVLAFFRQIYLRVIWFNLFLGKYVEAVANLEGLINVLSNGVTSKHLRLLFSDIEVYDFRLFFRDQILQRNYDSPHTFD